MTNTTLYPVASESFGYPGAYQSAGNRFFDWRKTILSQYDASPVLLSLIDGITSALDTQNRIDQFYENVWDIASAGTFGLDVWGRIVGVSRELTLPGEGDYLGFAEAESWETYGTGVFWNGGAMTNKYLMPNDVFRRVIMAKAALNITDGSCKSTNAILMALFPGYGNVWVRDNLDMTITFVVSSALSSVDYAIITQSGVIPKPAGVSFSVEQP